MGTNLGNHQLIDQSLTSRYSIWITEILDEIHENFLITDPSLYGHPIVFASSGFLKMSGYSRDEVVGKNGRMFQGPKTDRRSIQEIREAIREERSLQIKLLNYKKDGTPMWIVFHLSPVFSEDDGSVVHFISVQIPISTKVGPSHSFFLDIDMANGEDSSASQLDTWCSHSSHTRKSDVKTDTQKLANCFGSCRKELLNDSSTASSSSLLCNIEPKTRELQLEDSSKDIIVEKQKATTTINDILSTLTHYSKQIGKAVCRKRSASIHPRLMQISSSLSISLGRIKQSFVLTDPHSDDMPIIYASDAFLTLTGYSRHEILGRNCRFLQGPETDPETVCQIRGKIKTGNAFKVRIFNYRKDGSSFWNIVHVSPARNASGKVAFYVGAMLDEASIDESQVFSAEMRLMGAIGAVKVAIRGFFDVPPLQG